MRSSQPKDGVVLPWLLSSYAHAAQTVKYQHVRMQVYRRVADIPGEAVDIVCVFRRSQDLPQHAQDIIAAKPRVVWLQTGISNPEVEGQMVAAGIDVVVSRCLMVDRRAASSLL